MRIIPLSAEDTFFLLIALPIVPLEEANAHLADSLVYPHRGSYRIRTSTGRIAYCQLNTAAGVSVFHSSSVSASFFSRTGQNRPMTLCPAT